MAEQIAPGVWRVPLPMPEDHWIATANVHVITDDQGGMHLVDAGWDTDEAWSALDAAITGLGCTLGEIRSITLTHLHQDHRGLANRIRAASGATVRMHGADAGAQGSLRGPTEAELDDWGVPDQLRRELKGAELPPPRATQVDELLGDGDELAIGGRSMRVIHTPGHSPGSICVTIPGERVVLTGDHVLPDFYPGIGLSPVGTGEDALAEYLASLQRLRSLTGWRGLPGHGGVIDDLVKRVDETVAHQLRRGEAARARHAVAPGESVWQIASGLTWGPGWDGLRLWHRVSALRQTAMHLRYQGTL